MIEPFDQPLRRRLTISVVAAAATSLSIIYIILAAKSPGKRSPLPHFGIVIDAGSTGTRIHVFYARASAGTELPVIDADGTSVMRVTPGLSVFTKQPESAGAALLPLLAFAMEKVGRDRWAETEVRLMATAGLRMVEERAREAILESCRRVLRDSSFQFQDDWALVIPGYVEGIYAWVAANYALGTLGDVPEKTIGVIELGGASAQLTFVSDELLPLDAAHTLSVGRAVYKLYSSSFLHFGQNEAQKSLLEYLRLKDVKSPEESGKDRVFLDPCTPGGYHRGRDMVQSLTGHAKGKMENRLFRQPSGNFSECRSAISMLLQKGKENCKFGRCHLGSAFVPELHGQFLATENFFYTSKFFRLRANSPLSGFISAGRRFCESDWPELEKKYPDHKGEYLSHYCFSAAYIVALLHDNLGIPLSDTRIEYSNQVNGIQVEWALGAFVVHGITTPARSVSFIAVTWDSTGVFLIVLATSGLVFYIVWSVLGW